MSNAIHRNRYPLIILALVAALVATGWLLVIERSRHFSAGVTTAAGDQRVYRWTLVTTWPKNLPGLGRAPEFFAEKVAAMSNGRLQVKVFGAGELVPAFGVFDAVSQGAVEMGHGAAYYWKGKMPSAPFFTAVPFGLTAQEMNAWLYFGGGLELWRELYAPHGVVPFPAGNTGVQMAGWFNREIRSVADLKGLKMRIPGIGGEVFSRAGGTAVTIPGGELYTSLQTGVVDAAEWVAPYNDIALGLHEVTRYYYYPGWQEPGPTLELLVNARALASLPDDLRAIVEVAARAANQEMLDEYTARNDAALQDLLARGVDVRPLPVDVLRALKRASDAVLADITARDPMARKVYESWKPFADSVRQYHGISEQAYIEARDAVDLSPQ